MDAMRLRSLAREDSARRGRLLGCRQHGRRRVLLPDLRGRPASFPEELTRAVRAVLSGRLYVSPALAGLAAGALGRHGAPAAASAFTVLTGREREVLQLVAEGCSTEEVASRLCLSPKTVYTHRERIMDKLAIRSVAGLTRYAIREGLTSV